MTDAPDITTPTLERILDEEREQTLFAKQFPLPTLTSTVIHALIAARAEIEAQVEFVRQAATDAAEVRAELAAERKRSAELKSALAATTELAEDSGYRSHPEVKIARALLNRKEQAP